MRHWVIGLILVGELLASGTLFDASLVSDSKHLQPKAPLQMEKKATAPFKVKVKGFEASATGSKAGDTVTLKLTIEYSGGSGTKSVPWRIWRDSGQGEKEIARGQKEVTAGATGTFTATATWTATAGSHVFYGGIPIPEIPDNVSTRTTMVFTAPKVAAPPAPRLVTQVLDYQKAKLAGATFASASDNASGGGQCNWQSCDMFQAPQAQPGVFFFASVAGAFGTKATPEAYGNFTLKNSWKIKAVQLVEIKKSGGDWQWRVRPSEGSNNPFTRIHLWADMPLGDVQLGLKIVIEGPEGTDPYK